MKCFKCGKDTEGQYVFGEKVAICANCSNRKGNYMTIEDYLNKFVDSVHKEDVYAIIHKRNNDTITDNAFELKFEFTAEEVTFSLISRHEPMVLFTETRKTKTSAHNNAKAVLRTLDNYTIPEAVLQLLSKLHVLEKQNVDLDYQLKAADQSVELLYNTLKEIGNLRWYQRTRSRIVGLINKATND